MRLRISLRGMLALAALAAAICYWLDRPRRIANQFIVALEAKDQVALDRLVLNPERYERIFDMLGNTHTNASAQREGQMFSDWIKGECHVLFMINGPGNLPVFKGIAVASSKGLKVQNVERSEGLRIHVK